MTKKIAIRLSKKLLADAQRTYASYQSAETSNTDRTFYLGLATAYQCSARDVLYAQGYTMDVIEATVGNDLHTMPATTTTTQQ